jgi:hypothetical protein
VGKGTVNMKVRGFSLHWKIRRFKIELVFHCRTFNDFSDCDDVGTIQYDVMECDDVGTMQYDFMDVMKAGGLAL